MPGREFSKKVNTPAKSRQWTTVYESVKKSGASAGSAIRQANAAVKNAPAKGKKK